jgi:hypothetical protein
VNGASVLFGAEESLRFPLSLVGRDANEELEN